MLGITNKPGVVMDILNNTELDRIGTKDLMSKYGIGKTAFYERLKTANVKPVKDGTRSWISTHQLEELDRLDSHLASGGKLEDFVSNLADFSDLHSVQFSEQSTEQFTDHPPNGLLGSSSDMVLADGQSEMTRLINAMEAIAIAQHEPLRHYKELERAAEKGWILTSAEVKQLIGVKPTVKGSDRTFTRGSFSFVKSGKVGIQTGWKVLKVS